MRSSSWSNFSTTGSAALKNSLESRKWLFGLSIMKSRQLSRPRFVRHLSCTSGSRSGQLGGLGLLGCWLDGTAECWVDVPAECSLDVSAGCWLDGPAECWVDVPAECSLDVPAECWIDVPAGCWLDGSGLFSAEFLVRFVDGAVSSSVELSDGGRSRLVDENLLEYPFVARHIC